MNVFYAVVFISAFLAFQVQPMMARRILPWYGGGPAVWTTCLLFFQVMVVAGYGCAHGLVSVRSARRRTGLYLGLLVASLGFLPLIPWASLKPSGDEWPPAGILLLLAATAGLPCLALNATSPLMQRWFYQLHPERSPYPLYAVSNAGSLLALVSYPFLFEPTLTLHAQSCAWGLLYGPFAALAATISMRAASRPVVVSAAEGASGEEAAPGSRVVAGWVGMSACGSALLMAATNEMEQSVGAAPFLWVMPLALYLATFILCFEGPHWRRPGPTRALFQAGAVGACWLMYYGLRAPLMVQVLGHGAVLFMGCMVCHGELARRAPPARWLTRFYLAMAVGGAAGGAFVALAAPALFNGFWEYHIAVIGCLAVIMSAEPAARPRAAVVLDALLAVLIAVTLGAHVWRESGQATAAYRNFYGELRVIHEGRGRARCARLVHGPIVHGSQFRQADRRRKPTTYFGPNSGVGLCLRFHPRRLAGKPMKVGVVGLGAGTLAAYGQWQDRLMFFEINPAVADFAATWFTYLADSKASKEVLLGDGRLTLERLAAEGRDQRFNVLVVDAFSGDAVPTHLLTVQAFETYLRHLSPDGLLALNVSNRFVRLQGVVRGLAHALGCAALYVDSSAIPVEGLERAQWVIAARQRSLLDAPAFRAARTPWPLGSKPRLWTDDYSSLAPLLK